MKVNELYNFRKKQLNDLTSQIKKLQKDRKKIQAYINLVDYRAKNKEN